MSSRRNVNTEQHNTRGDDDARARIARDTFWGVPVTFVVERVELCCVCFHYGIYAHAGAIINKVLHFFFLFFVRAHVGRKVGPTFRGFRGGVRRTPRHAEHGHTRTSTIMNSFSTWSLAHTS